MAYSSKVARSWYENISPEEIVVEYNKCLEKIEIPDTKEERIKKYIDNILFPSMKTNIYSSMEALEELYLEKTGKELERPKKKELEKIILDDVIKYVSVDPFWTTAITDFFKKIDKTDDEKMNFLIYLYVDKESFNEFTKEILKTDDALSTYKKYEEIANHYIGSHSYKG